MDKPEECISEVLSKFGMLTESEVIFYLKRKEPSRSVERLMADIRQAVKKGIIYRDGLNLSACGRKKKIERDMAIAFRVFAECCEIDCHCTAAEWPSSIIFTTKEDRLPIRITVCSDPKTDTNLSVLKNKRWDGNFHEIIVGVNFSADQLNEDLIPDSKTTFVEYRAARPLIDEPETTYVMLREKRKEEKED